VADLDGVRVLDLSIWRPGPYATQLLAERGADVIKVEPPGGDPMRVYGGLFDSLNAGKRSVMLDLKDAAGRRAALDLAAEADVVVEGFRPGVVARLGVDYTAVAAVQPAIVYCSISGFGQTGPLAVAPGHDLNYMAWAGSLAPERGAPRWPAVAMADLAGGMAAALAISTALVAHARTGGGRHIDIAMTDVLATWTGAVSSAATNVGTTQRGSPGYGIFATADGGHVTLGIVTEDHFWRPLCDVLGFTAERDLGFPDRLARVGELQERLTEVIATRTRDALVADLLAAGVPAAPVFDRAEMLSSDQIRSREVFADALPPAPGLDEHRGASFFARR
jgi:crotonobetainyl-CoA:carnitine CoA-transferase CaiB-like acyl-CoA transferase